MAPSGVSFGVRADRAAAELEDALCPDRHCRRKAAQRDHLEEHIKPEARKQGQRDRHASRRNAKLRIGRSHAREE